jgi:hypothetical protein
MSGVDAAAIVDVRKGPPVSFAILEACTDRDDVQRDFLGLKAGSHEFLYLAH